MDSNYSPSSDSWCQDKMTRSASGTKKHFDERNCPSQYFIEDGVQKKKLHLVWKLRFLFAKKAVDHLCDGLLMGLK